MTIVSIYAVFIILLKTYSTRAPEENIDSGVNFVYGTWDIELRTTHVVLRYVRVGAMPFSLHRITTLRAQSRGWPTYRQVEAYVSTSTYVTYGEKLVA